jgi:phosphatidylethanolamine-binding protein (PEBP) family uncharacterized protein
MRRARLAVVIPTVLVAALVGAACDTDDGREMRPPSSEQRRNFEARNTTTTTTLFPASSVVDLVTPASDVPPSDAAAAAATTTAPATTAAATTAAAAAPLQAPWADGAAIDARYSCDGAEEVPVIRWAAPDAGVVELALAVTDDNAGGYVHWLVTGIPGAAGAIGGTEAPVGVEQANSAGTVGWTGPCPPAGEVHTYRVALYSLDAPFAPVADEPPQNILGDIGGSATGVHELTGTYQRAA